MSPGCKLTDKVQKDVLQMLEGYLTSTDDSTRIAAAACLGTLCRILDGDILSTVIASDLLGECLFSFSIIVATSWVNFYSHFQLL